MNKAQYLSTNNASGGNGKFPLSTAGLDFIQNQIELLQALTLIGGKRFILKMPENGQPGVVVIDGEVFSLAAAPTSGKGIRVVETREDIEADGTLYKEARIIRSAQYVATYASGTPDLYPASDFNNFATNQTLYGQLMNINAVNGEIARRLYVAEGVFSRNAIDTSLTNMRLQCRAGSAKINGTTEYTINVYRSGTSCTQEQILPDMRRFKREYNFTSKKWSEFTPITENLHLEVKIVRRTTVYVRHGVLPAGVQLVLLRKKRRGKWRATGGGRAYADNKGQRHKRQSKNQYVHYKGVVLTTGEPNKWYVPKCASVFNPKADGNLVGKELSTVCAGLIAGATYLLNTVGVCKLRGTRKKIAYRNSGTELPTTGYVKIALQFAAVGNNVSKSSGGEPVELKYRGWFTTPATRLPPFLLRGFSVE